MTMLSMLQRSAEQHAQRNCLGWLVQPALGLNGPAWAVGSAMPGIGVQAADSASGEGSASNWYVDTKPATASTRRQQRRSTARNRSVVGSLQARFVFATYAECMSLARQLGSGLKYVGRLNGAEDRVGILVANSPEWVLTDWACHCYGLVSVALQAPRLAGRDGLAEVLQLVHCDLIVCDERWTSDLLDACTAGKCPDLRAIVQTGRLGFREQVRAAQLGVQLRDFAFVMAAGKAYPVKVRPPQPDQRAALTIGWRKRSLAVPLATAAAARGGHEPSSTMASARHHAESGTAGPFQAGLGSPVVDGDSPPPGRRQVVTQRPEPYVVAHTHKSLLGMALRLRATAAGTLLGAADVHASYVPLAYEGERIVTTLALRLGMAVGFIPEGSEELNRYVGLLRPTFLTVTPRLLETAYTRFQRIRRSWSKAYSILLARALRAKQREAPHAFGFDPAKWFDAAVLRPLAAAVDARSVRFLLVMGTSIPTTLVPPYIQEVSRSLFGIPVIEAITNPEIGFLAMSDACGAHRPRLRSALQGFLVPGLRLDIERPPKSSLQPTLSKAHLAVPCSGAPPDRRLLIAKLRPATMRELRAGLGDDAPAQLLTPNHVAIGHTLRALSGAGSVGGSAAGERHRSSQGGRQSRRPREVPEMQPPRFVMELVGEEALRQLDALLHRSDKLEPNYASLTPSNSLRLVALQSGPHCPAPAQDAITPLTAAGTAQSAPFVDLGARSADHLAGQQSPLIHHSSAAFASAPTPLPPMPPAIRVRRLSLGGASSLTTGSFVCLDQLDATYACACPEVREVCTLLVSRQVLEGRTLSPTGRAASTGDHAVVAVVSVHRENTHVWANAAALSVGRDLHLDSGWEALAGLDMTVEPPLIGAVAETLRETVQRHGMSTGWVPAAAHEPAARQVLQAAGRRKSGPSEALVNGHKLSGLCCSRELRRYILRQMRARAAAVGLSEEETVQHVVLTPEPFNCARGLATPSGNLLRRAIAARFVIAPLCFEQTHSLHGLVDEAVGETGLDGAGAGRLLRQESALHAWQAAPAVGQLPLRRVALLRNVLRAIMRLRNTKNKEEKQGLDEAGGES